MTEQYTAWVHPRFPAFVVLPDGLSMNKEEAIGKGIAVEPWPADQKYVTSNPHAPEYLIAPRSLSLSAEHARSVGFEVRTGQSGTDANPGKAWRATIIKSQEANARPAAAAELLATQSPASMTAEKALAFLRGLPAEATTPKVATPAPIDPKAARLAEIEASARSFNRANGYSVKPGRAPSLASVPASRLQRLAELRLASLTTRMERGDSAASRERMNLQHALKTTAMTGKPLIQSLQAMGIDPVSIVGSN